MRNFKKIAAGFAAAAIAFTMVATMAPSVASAAVSKEGEAAHIMHILDWSRLVHGFSVTLGTESNYSICNYYGFLPNC